MADSGVRTWREGSALWVQIDRPKRRNAISHGAMRAIRQALEAAAGDQGVAVAVLTGSGSVYSSGADLRSSLALVDAGDLEGLAAANASHWAPFVRAFVDFPKPLVAAVNGRAVGGMVTTLALCDLVYASDRARFSTPFAKLGLVPEGCSSLLFPRLMGRAKAHQVLMMGEELSAGEAQRAGLVTRVFPEDAFEREILAEVKILQDLPPQSLRLIKKLCVDREELHATNDAEVRLLQEAWRSGRPSEAIRDFFAKKRAKL